MTETIDAIQDRLSPGRLASDVKDATIGRVQMIVERTADRAAGASRGAIDTIKAHPGATAVAGAAAMALVFVVWRSRNGSARAGHSSELDYARQTSMFGPNHSTGFGRNKQTFLLGACAGLSFWSAWRSKRAEGDRRSAAITIPWDEAME